MATGVSFCKNPPVNNVLMGTVSVLEMTVVTAAQQCECT